MRARHSALTAITSAVTALLLSAAPTAAPTAFAANDDERAIRLQNDMDAYLTQYPGGTQVSDNALAYRNGDVVIVFPAPDSRTAPPKLGNNVRDTYLAQRLRQQMSVVSAVYGCPDGGWYCFYSDSNFGGRRYQFLNTCSDYASNWGFSNVTSSWVNTNPYSQILTWDYLNGPGLWATPYGLSYSSWVGSLANDRMSFWARTNC
jgi:hypothetical protein